MKRAHGLTPMQRIERRRTITTTGCWETPYLPSKAYPALKIDGRHILVHRISYEHYIGPIPPGLFVCHKCDNPRCHNPDHLFIGDAFDNMRDMAAKGRAGTGTPPVFDRDAITALAHLSQVEIAKLVGATQTTVSRVLSKAGLSRGKTTTFGKVRKGAAHGRALVTEDQVLTIRKDPRTLAVIAAEYGVSKSTIQAIKARRTWAHLPDE